VFYQLDVLRHCLPSSVRSTLKELPESLDESYERILKEIKWVNRVHAHRIFQCLLVAIRPLRVEELAEVLAIDFDDPEGIAKLEPTWRCKDAEQVLLSLCSSLITIVGARNSRVVQFAHFSVKEFLTSPRLAASSKDVSRYHIALTSAHTILGQACLGVLLRLDGHLRNDIRKASPLAGYAAQHWVTHAQVENVSSYLRKPMEHLFDLNKPYFAAWLKLHDVDLCPGLGSTFFMFCPPAKQDAAPLYYAVLCGFRDLSEHLIVKYPHQVNAHGGYYVTPLVAALAKEHLQVADDLVFRHGAGTTVNFRGKESRIPLHSAAYYGQVDAVQLLLRYKADVKCEDFFGWTALHYLGMGRIWDHREDPQKFERVAQLLLEHGADVNARNPIGSTPLHTAAFHGNVTVACVLLENGANVHEPDNKCKTPFRLAWERGQDEIMKLLAEHGSRC